MSIESFKVKLLHGGSMGIMIKQSSKRIQYWFISKAKVLNDCKMFSQDRIFRKWWINTQRFQIGLFFIEFSDVVIKAAHSLLAHTISVLFFLKTRNGNDYITVIFLCWILLPIFKSKCKFSASYSRTSIYVSDNRLIF